MKKLIGVLALLFFWMTTAQAQTTTYTPNGLGGYNAYNYGTGSTTAITPNGLGGYNAYKY